MARRPDVGLSIAILLFALAFAGLRIYSRMAGRGRRASGTVVLTGTSFGTTQFSVEDCKRLQIDGAFPYGVEIVGSGKHDLRLVRHERDDDVQVSLYPKGNPGAAIAIDRSKCSQWKVSFFAEGGVDFTCAFAGGTIDGTVFADGCRP